MSHEVSDDELVRVARNATVRAADLYVALRKVQAIVAGHVKTCEDCKAVARVVDAAVKEHNA